MNVDVYSYQLLHFFQKPYFSFNCVCVYMCGTEDVLFVVRGMCVSIKGKENF